VNLHRRQLTTSQRAAIAVESLPMLEAEAEQRKLAKLKKGKEIPDSAQMRSREKGKSAGVAAKATNVSSRYVEEAKAIKEQAPERFEDIKQGKATISEVRAELAPVKPQESLREIVEAQCQRLLDKHAVCDHAQVKIIVLEYFADQTNEFGI
jgi:hypothetical protein